MRKLSLLARVLSLSALGCVGAAVVVVQLHRAPAHAYDAQIQQLEIEMAGLSKATPAAAKRAKDQVVEMTNALWSEERLAEWVASLPKGWVVHELGSAEVKAVSLRRFSIERVQPAFEHWPEIKSTIDRLSTLPGLALRTVSIIREAPPTRSFRKVLLIATIAFPISAPAAAAEAPASTSATP